jgi:ubiquinone biosynthesis protein COQ4
VTSRFLAEPLAPTARPGSSELPVARNHALERERRRTNRGRVLRTIYAAFMLARDPNRTKYVFMIGRAQDDSAEDQRQAGLVVDPFKSEALETMWRHRFAAERYDIDALLELPADTLGGAYARHMNANGLKPDYCHDEQPRHRMAWLRTRIHQTHDIWHLLTGFGTDEYGEVGLQGFYLAQFPNGQAAIIAAGAILKSVLRGRFAELQRHVEAFCFGYCAGRRADSLLAVRWEELWRENLDDLRRRYGISVEKADVPPESRPRRT